MTKYFNVKVYVFTTNDKGQTKKETQQYVVEAISVTDAEVRTIACRKELGWTEDFEIASASESKIVGVILDSAKRSPDEI